MGQGRCVNQGQGPAGAAASPSPPSQPPDTQLCPRCGRRPLPNSRHAACFICLAEGAAPPTSVPPPRHPSLAPSASPIDTAFIDGKMEQAFGRPMLNRPGHQDATQWQKWHSRICQLSGRRFGVPGGNVGDRVVGVVADAVEQYAAKACPSEVILVGKAVILQRHPHVTTFKDRRRVVDRRIAMWRQGKVEELVLEAERCDKLGPPLKPLKGDEDENEHTIRVFSRLVDQGRLRQAQRFLTERGGGGVLDPQDVAENDTRTVREVLADKHPQQRTADPAAFIDGDLPPLVGVDITANQVERAAREIQGGVGPSGGDATLWKDLLLKHGGHSTRLRQAVADATRMMANEVVDWEHVQALRGCRLLALDKCPGVRPIGVGEVLMRIMGKAMSMESAFDLERECGEDQLCAGLKGGIEAAIHAVSGLFDCGEGEAECVLLGDATNAFNTLSRPAALWSARHLWPRASRFLFNTYQGHAALYLRGEKEPLWSQEGTTQGDPMAMPMYAAGTLPLIRSLKEPAEQGPQVWFADDSSKCSSLERASEWWDKLGERGPPYGYFPNAHKSILVVREGLEERAREVFEGVEGLTITTGSRYLGGYVGTREGRRAYVQQKVERWEECIRDVARAATKRPQQAHVVMTKSLQAEWDFVMRVIPEEKETFEPLRHLLATTYLPGLCGKSVDEAEAAVMLLSARHGGTGVRDPTERVAEAYETSIQGTDVLTIAIQRGTHPDQPFDPSIHRLQVHTAIHEGKRRADARAKERFDDGVSRLPPGCQRAARRAQEAKTHAWLTAMPSCSDQTDLSGDAFRDGLAVLYGYRPSNLPSSCPGCGSAFTLTHALDCPKGGLVIQRQNELRDVIGDVGRMAFGAGSVHKEVVLKEGDGRGREGVRTDLVIRGVWDR
ncbi:unnamed protein product [Vitrella brassicaformis CCMP3155]|uniref:Reverse transcriptase domain-containing protein n=1 Tax=Vitrella brassicaformis (strain CCMP3155) TaxID=1169540 RepID=A0A0G4GBR9_VITBC|nr:unnamed protein product [Vitrella brassicaformis CCMP3155]|eukprot:CEM26585.1 unnamed protein product [Vitrella brassicaformis CCMP3155]